VLDEDGHRMREGHVQWHVGIRKLTCENEIEGNP
jgi:hypothetical protein